MNRNHCPDIAASHQHRVHQEARQTSVTIHIRMDIDEEKVTQYGTDSWVRLVFDEFKKGWHAIANRLFGWWNMPGAANIDLVITLSGQFCRFENSGLNAGAEEGQIPGTDRFTHSLDARMSCRSGNKILDEFVGLEIALGGQGIADRLV